MTKRGASVRAVVARAAILAVFSAACRTTGVPAPATAPSNTRTPETAGATAARSALNTPVNPRRGPYPQGQYGGHLRGDRLADLEMVGHMRSMSTGLALDAPLGAVRLSDLRARSSAKYAVIHMSAYWCGRCKAAARTLVASYAKYASKAIFVEVLVEGSSPGDTVAANELEHWVTDARIPFTATRDPDGVSFRARAMLGALDTTYVVDLDSMRIAWASHSVAPALDYLDRYE